MDPLTAFATITQLVGLFIQERRSSKERNKEAFLGWLITHRHEEIKELICNTQHLSEQVDDLLRADHADILRELRTANGTLAQVMSRLQGFAAITETLVPSDCLSDFSYAALCHFNESRETHMITSPDGSGVQFGNQGAIKHDDPRFLKDDMEALESCGFIQLYKDKGSYSIYTLTRNGAAYATLLEHQSEQTS